MAEPGGRAHGGRAHGGRAHGGRAHGGRAWWQSLVAEPGQAFGVRHDFEDNKDS